MTTETAITLAVAIFTARAAAYNAKGYSIPASEVTRYADSLAAVAAAPDWQSALKIASAHNDGKTQAGWTSTYNNAVTVIVGHLAYAEIERTFPGGYAATTGKDKAVRGARMAYIGISRAADSLTAEARFCGVSA